jgi:transposase
MAGFVVGAHDIVAGELWLYVETTADIVGCSECGTRAIGHGRARTAVRDLPISGRPTVLMWSKRRWRCPDPDCGVNTWSETTEAIAARAVLTERARRRLAEMVNVDGDSIAGAAGEFGVGWHTANQAVAEYTDPHIDDPDRLEGVTAIGVDEKRFLNATVDHRTVYTTQIVDLDRHRLLDVIEVGTSSTGPSPPDRCVQHHLHHRITTHPAGDALPEIGPRLVLGEADCRLWAGKLVVAHG